MPVVPGRQLSQLSSFSKKSTSPTYFSEPPHFDTTNLEVADLREIVKKLTKENELKNSENLVLEAYLKKMEPACLQSMEEEIEKSGVYGTTPGRSFSTVLSTKSHYSMVVSKQRQQNESSSYRLPTGQSIIKVNTSFKIDMTGQLADASDKNAKLFVENCKIKRKLYYNRLREIKMRINEVHESQEHFEDFQKTYKNPVTKRISGLKIVRFMEDWVKKFDATIQKYRLERSELRKKLDKLTQLENGYDKLQGGSIASKIDFDYLNANNQRLIENIERKSLQLRVRRKSFAKNAITIMTQKEFVKMQVIQFKRLKVEIYKKQQRIYEYTQQQHKVRRECHKAYKYLQQLIMLKKHAPSYATNVADYINQCSELRELQRQIKYARRRSEVQNTLIETIKRKLSNFTPTGTTPLFHLSL